MPNLTKLCAVDSGIVLQSIIYNLPDALWVYAFTNAMLIIWNNEISSKSLIWILLAPLLAICWEIGQGINIVPGTFDVIDIVAVIIGALLPFAKLFIYTQSKQKLNIYSNTLKQL